ncbi:MAG: acyltransferase, partial [Pseudomonadales bacterium]|nr:acyltransferase [Pseudomonadales bacterium]
MNYRPDIDGLRAIAVSSVIVYHAALSLAGIQLLPGGYLGVDIFFVISGYLITTQITQSLWSPQGFSLGDFYERRIRRILPVLLTVMLCSVPVAWQLLLPADFIGYSKSLLSSLLFVSNFYFWHSGLEYEATDALLIPFLHTWSLSIEEQFYVLFPLLLILTRKLQAQQLMIVCSTLLLASLACAEYLSQTDRSLSFYSPLTRAWELLAGALLALWAGSQAARAGIRLAPGLIRSLRYSAMMVLIVCLMWFDSETVHPGLLTLIPVLATALLIALPGDDLLAAKPVVTIGLLSYSLYLWHYPVFAFGRIYLTTPDTGDKLGWIFLTLALSVLSYHLIEKPFRHRQRFRFRYAGPVIITVILITAGLQILVIRENGYWQ